MKSLSILAMAAAASAYDIAFRFNAAPTVENRTIDEIYQAALKEGSTVTLWHGGDELNQQDALKKAFEARFPGLTLNVTVDLSKYHDVNLDKLLVDNNVYVDAVALQTLHDFPRWRDEGALLHYQPLGFNQVYPGLRDVWASYYAIVGFSWSFLWNADKLPSGTQLREFPDLLQPAFKDKLVLTYPNDDDAVLYAFDLVLQQYGYSWLEGLLAQNPRWVRGTATPATLIGQANATDSAATFTAGVGVEAPAAPLNISLPTEGRFVSWGQSAAILRDAPHPEGAKLLMNFLLSAEYQNQTGSYSVRSDVPSAGPNKDWFAIPATDPIDFARFMADRARVERLRFFFEDRLGSAQGLSPLVDNL